jgi:hypothetical protein
MQEDAAVSVAQWHGITDEQWCYTSRSEPNHRPISQIGLIWLLTSDVHQRRGSALEWKRGEGMLRTWPGETGAAVVVGHLVGRDGGAVVGARVELREVEHDRRV